MIRVPVPAGFVPFEGEALRGSVPERFEWIVEQHPGRIAVKAKDRTLTYAALNQLSNKIARAILAGRGEEGQTVALLFGHGGGMIAAMLGVLKAGKCYVPIAPDHPTARQIFLLEDALAKVIVTDMQHHPQVEALAGEEIEVIVIEQLGEWFRSDNLNLAVAPEALASLHYTSGSTGVPKGAAKNHFFILSSIHQKTNRQRLCYTDRVSLLASYAFGASMSGIYSPLLNGGMVLPYDIKEEGLVPLADFMRREAITIYHSTPTVFRHFAKHLNPKDRFPKLRIIRLGGEAVLKHDVDLFKRHFSEYSILRVSYGSTEAGGITEDFIDKYSRIEAGVVPPGYLIEGAEILLWDEEGREVGTGERGEIVLRSERLSPGYWRRPELTAAAFIPDTAKGSGFLYRSGDLGEWLPDGRLAHLGRKDQQVKISGQRVEVGEVETAVLAHPKVSEAAVSIGEDTLGNKRLTAYIVPQRDEAPLAAELRRFLLEKLPDFMIPSAFVFLEALPKTASGKVDRLSLPEPDRGRPELAEPYAPPRTQIEVKLMEIWSGVLGIQAVGIRDDFFELGGSSLQAAEIFAQIELELGKRVPLAVLLEAPTIEQAAKILMSEAHTGTWSAIVAFRTEGSQPPLFCVTGRGGDVLTFKDLARHLGEQQPFYGFRAQGMDGIRAPYTSLEEMAAHNIEEMRNVQAVGPYFLGGYSGGGMVVYEMAQQLIKQGEEIGLLLLFDAYGPGYSRPMPLGARFYGHLEILRGMSWAAKMEYLSGNLSGRVTNLRNQLQERIREYREPVFRKLREVRLANMWARSAYVAEEYEGDVVLLRARRQPAWMRPDPLMGWGPLVKGRIEVHEVPGYHEAIFYEPLVGKLAEKVREILKATQSAREPSPDLDG